MKQFRRIVFWSHLVTGVTVALVVLVMAATGVLMSFERQIVEWVDRGALTVDRDASAHLRPTEELLASLPDSLGTLRTLTWRGGALTGVITVTGRDGTWFVDAGTGAVLGTPDPAVRAFFDGVLSVHRWLAVSDEARGFGRAVTGASNALLLFMLFSGLLLWWPRNWKKAAVLNVVLLRRGLSTKARKFNRHNVLGIWSVIPLVVIAGTGLMLSYPSAGDGAFAVYERLASDRQVLNPVPEAPDRTPADSGEAETLSDLVSTASRVVPQWRTLTMNVPATTADRVVFIIDRGTGGQPQKQAELILDRQSGAIMEFVPFECESAGTRFFDMLRYVHTGEAFGPAGQFVAGLVSLAVVFLVWTGVTLAWMRGMRSLRRRQRG